MEIIFHFVYGCECVLFNGEKENNSWKGSIRCGGVSVKTTPRGDFIKGEAGGCPPHGSGEGQELRGRHPLCHSLTTGEGP